MELSQAREIAEGWVEVLRDSCQRIEIAGSVRREKPECHDIDIVAVPKMRTEADLFGQPTREVNCLADVLCIMEAEGSFQIVKGGAKYKQIALPERINLELWMVTPPAQFGVLYVIRTGPAEFGHWMVTPRAKGGALPDNYYVDRGAVWPAYEYTHDGRRSRITHHIDMPEEMDFLRFCGLPWIEPKDRQPRWNRAAAQPQRGRDE